MLNIPLARYAGMAAAILILALPIRAQSPNSLAADRARLAEITGDSSMAGTLPSVRLTDLPLLRRLPDTTASRITVVRPAIYLIRNSALPYSLNDGPLWAGRGTSISVTGGVQLEHVIRGSSLNGAVLQFVLAPTVLYSQNKPFQVFPNTTPGRSSWANPFHGTEASLDLPHRFGDRHLLGFDPGLSRLAVRWPLVEAGVTAANEWWGPGIRNAIIASNNAPGVPRLYAQTSRPINTWLGKLDVKLFSGTLTQSLFFDPTASENRTLSGILLQLQPRFDSTLTFGFARVVYSPIGPDASPLTLTLSRSFDAVTRWENLEGPGLQRSDQIGALFARWIFPRAGFEVYGEWARMDLPRTVTELLTAAHHTGGWTFGFQWAQPRRNHSYLRLQSELTYLEQSRVFPERATPDFYSGMASPQGYTQRGQVIGAAIGPGASSQWIATDWITRAWQAGGFIGRIRWDNDAMYRRVATFWDHDVSLLAGLRGGWRTRLTDFSVELTAAKRYNYLFQNGIARPGVRTVDVNNFTLALSATPR